MFPNVYCSLLNLANVIFIYLKVKHAKNVKKIPEQFVVTLRLSLETLSSEARRWERQCLPCFTGNMQDGCPREMVPVTQVLRYINLYQCSLKVSQQFQPWPWAILFTVSSARTHNRHRFCSAMFRFVNTLKTPVTFTARRPVRYYRFRHSFHTTHTTTLHADAW